MQTRSNRNGVGRWVAASSLTGLLLFYLLAHHFAGNRLEFPTDTIEGYSPCAESLSTGQGTLRGENCLRHGPGFSLFLSFIYRVSGQAGTRNDVYPYCGLLLVWGSVFLLYLIAREAKLLKNPAWVIGVAGSYPFFLLLASTRYVWTATPLLMFCFYSSAGLLFWGANTKSPLMLFLSGFALGAAKLTWAGLFYVFLVLFPYAGLKTRRWGLVVLFIIGISIPLGLWMRNVPARAAFNSAAGPSFLDGLIHTPQSVLRRYPLAKRIADRRMTAPLGSAEALRLVGQEFVENPVTTAAFFGFKSLRPWYATDSERYERTILFFQAAYLLLAAYGGFLGMRRAKQETYCLMAVTAYFWLMSFIVLSILRYMIPAMGLLMIFSAAGVEDLVGRLGRK